MARLGQDHRADTLWWLEGLSPERAVAYLDRQIHDLGVTERIIQNKMSAAHILRKDIETTGELPKS